MNETELARDIIVLRSKKGWTQQELAEHIGTTQRTVAAWETGRSIPRKAMLVRIARVFDLPAEHFLTEMMEEKSPPAEPKAAETDLMELFSEFLDQQKGLTQEKKAEYLDSASRFLNK